MHIYPSIATAQNEYASWWSSPDAVKPKVTCDPVIYDVLDANTVIMTIIGSIVKVEKTDPDEKPWIIAYTMVWQKEKSGWKVFHMHNSWE